VRHLTLPILTGACSTDADRIDKIEPLTDETCRVHLKVVTPRYTGEEGQVKKGAHGIFDVRLPAQELRSAIADMDDGDVYDPWNLDMVGEIE